MEFLIGADPELFVSDLSGKFISAHGLVKGTKKEPEPVNKGAIQVDGMALEFNINPAKNEEEFVDNIFCVKDILQKRMDKFGYKLNIKPSVVFDKDVWDSTPKEAKILGCDPDYNAYTGAPNNPPDNKTKMRTAAGHIHIGWTSGEDLDNPNHIAVCHDVVKQLDATVGLLSLIFDKDNTRRKMYGKAGCYRPKPYGVEYRVLSNFWLKNPYLTSMVYKTTMKALNDLLNGKRWTQGDIPYFINTDKPNLEQVKELLFKRDINV